MKVSLSRIAMVLACTVAIGTACSPTENVQNKTHQVEQQGQYLAKLYNEYFDANLRLNPSRATALGNHQYNDRLENPLSEEHRARQRMLEEEYLSALEKVDVTPLDEHQRLSYEIFK